MEKDLMRFVESLTVSDNNIEKETVEGFKESNKDYKITESKEIRDTDEIWRVPISRYGVMNGNGRVYNKKLWENVIKNQKDTWYGSPCLMDHPSEDSSGDPNRICGVWLGLDIDKDPDKGFVYGYLIPSGRLGEDLKDHVKNHLRAGLSSSGFGRLLPDGKTVDPDTYEIERIADLVLMPSQQVYFGIDEDNHIKNISPVLESTDNPGSMYESSQVENKTTNNIYKENIVKDSAKIAKLEEKKFRRDMESFLEEAIAIKDPQERLQEFREIKSYLEDGACPDLKEQIEQKIAEEEEYIKTAIKEKAEFKEKFDVDSPKELEEKLTKIVEESSSFNKEAQDWKAVAEKLQSKLNEKNKELEERPTSQFVEYLNNKIEALENQLKDYKGKFVEFAQKATKEASSLKESRGGVQKELEDVKKEKQELTEQLNKAQQNLAAANVLTETATKEKNKIEESFRALTTSYNTLKVNYDSSVVKMKESSEKASGAEKELTEVINSLTAQLNENQEKIKSLSSIITKQRESIEKSASSEIALKEIIAKQKNMLNEMAKQTKDAQFKLFGKASTSKKAEKTNSPVVNYYESLYKRYGNAIVPFKETLIKSMSVADAKNKFYRNVLPNLPESEEIESMRLPENAGLPHEERLEKIGMKEAKSNAVNNVLNKYKGWM